MRWLNKENHKYRYEVWSYDSFHIPDPEYASDIEPKCEYRTDNKKDAEQFVANLIDEYAFEKPYIVDIWSENMDKKLEELASEWRAKSREVGSNTFRFSGDRLMIRRTNEEWLEDAYEIALIVHKGQVRKFANNEGYIHHPVRVAQNLSTKGHSSIVQSIGLLHDTIEDGDGESLLENAGFPPILIRKIKALSKPDGMGKTDKDYLDWIRSMEDKDVIAVKMADLEDNMTWRSKKEPSEQWLRLKERYKKAWDILNEKKG